MNGRARSTEEIALGLAVAVIGAVFLWASLHIPEGRDLVGPRTVPAVTSGLLVLGGTAIAVQALRGQAGPPAEAGRRLFGIVLPGIALALAFLWLWGALGWTLASLVIAPVFFAIFGARGWRELVLFPACVVAVLYLVFYQLLGLWHGTGWMIERLGLA